jgi:short-subunit dehydrogenase
MTSATTKDKSRSYALITGASRGFGKYLALELAKRAINTILVSLPDNELLGVRTQCQSYGVDCLCYETDLTEKENILSLTQWVNQHYNISILINNAGFGVTNNFSESDLNHIDDLIQLNIVATTLITHQLLSNLLKQDDAYILNVSSMASFSPIGYKTVYSASKTYIQHFSQGLHEELRSTKVFVSAVHPGPMKTNASVTKRILHQGLIGKIGLLSPQRAAEITIRRLFKRKKFILLGQKNYLVWLLLTIVPLKIRLPLMSRFARREINI